MANEDSVRVSPALLLVGLLLPLCTLGCRVPTRSAYTAYPSMVSSVTFPDHIVAGVAFDAVVHTWGPDGCWSAGGTTVVDIPGGALLLPEDIVRQGQSACSAALAHFQHRVTLLYGSPGRVQVVVRSRIPPGQDLEYLTYEIDVDPIASPGWTRRPEGSIFSISIAGTRNQSRRMRIALISDIHANWHALEAVDVSLKQEAPEAVLCLGDIVGYGAFPSECIAWVREHCDRTIIGNHDLIASQSGDSSWFNALARAALNWTHERLTDAEKVWLLDLPYVEDFEEIRLSHGHPLQPEAWLYVLNQEEADVALRSTTAHVVAVGHSHLQGLFTEEGDAAGFVVGEPYRLGSHRAVINPGSVGQPRGGDPRAAWLLVDTADWTLHPMRVEYDLEGARQAIIEAGLPEQLGDRLLEGR